MKPKAASKQSPQSTPRPLKGLRMMLVGLLMTCVAVMSGCQSSLPMPKEQPSKLTIEASLMVEPNYTQRLLRLLSESPEMQTAK